jgi:hypothetical protein
LNFELKVRMALHTGEADLREEQSNKEGVALCLAGLAGVVGVQGQPERAARIYGAAETLFEAVGARLSPYDRADYDRNRDAVRSQLGTSCLGGRKVVT